MLMRHEKHGWQYAANIEEMKNNGWIESSDEEFKKFVADKAKKLNSPKEELPKEVAESAIIEPQVIAKGKPGRKPKFF